MERNVQTSESLYDSDDDSEHCVELIAESDNKN
jgi:hypothetical protein